MSTTTALIRSMRPRQWTKNLIVFAPALFGGVLADPGVARRSTLAFALLCALSGAVYLMNDLRDAEVDRAYDKTRERPIAAGALDCRIAGSSSAALALGALVGASALGVRFAALLVGYLALQVAYTFVLKRFAVIDVLTITAGFVVRAMAGAAAVGVPDSPWLLVCAACLVTFLGLSKRRQELADLGEAAPRHRPALARYPLGALDSMLASALGATVVSYLVYTLLSAGARQHPLLVLTTPLVVFGLFRYSALVYSARSSRSAEDVLLTDVPILLSVMLWAALAVAFVYVV